MKLKLRTLRKLVREALSEQAWVPGRYYPSTNEPLSGDEQDKLNQPSGMFSDFDELDEVDTDPSNNPGRPADAHDYIGMRPKSTYALAHPSLDGGAGATGAAPGETPGVTGGVAADAGTEPTED